MSYEKKLALNKQSPAERHPYGAEKKKYRKRLNRIGRRILKRLLNKEYPDA
jgi:hypothetical protein